MDGFWHTLFRFNARHLALGAAVLLMLAMLAWLVSLVPHSTKPDMADAVPTAGLNGTAKDGTPLPAPGEGDDGQASPFESKHLSELVALSDEGLLRWDTPSDPAREPPPEAPPPEEPKEPPKPRTVNVLYVGMMTRTDGTTIAFMTKEGQEQPENYAAGAAFIDGVKITDIQRGHVEVEAGGKKVALPRGIRQALEY